MGHESPQLEKEVTGKNVFPWFGMTVQDETAILNDF